MRISDDERREVAENLRNLTIGHSIQYKEQFFDELAEVVVGFEDYHDFDVVLDKLADLIDRPTTTRHGKFKTKYGRQTPCCEVCGYSIGDMRWNNCPKCGAVITDD